MTLQTPVCPTCGSQNPCGQQFCGTCGARLLGDKPQADKDQQTYSCPECGQAVAQDAKFCGRCGTSLNSPAQENPDNSILTGIDGQKKNKKKNSELMITIALVVATLLVGGGAFVLSVLSQKVPPTSSIQTQEALKIYSYSSYVDSYGYFRIVGEVENIGENSTEKNRVTATFYDENGISGLTCSGNCYLDIIKSGGMSPFEIVIPTPPELKSYSLTVEWQVADRESNCEMVARDIEAKTDEDGYYIVTGKVTNTGERYLDTVMVVGTFYDSKGTVVAVGVIFCDAVPLQSNETATFTIAIDPCVTSNIHNYSLQAMGYD
jgi:hypothetical protein